MVFVIIIYWVLFIIFTTFSLRVYLSYNIYDTKINKWINGYTIKCVKLIKIEQLDDEYYIYLDCDIILKNDEQTVSITLIASNLELIGEMLKSFKDKLYVKNYSGFNLTIMSEINRTLKEIDKTKRENKILNNIIKINSK